MTCTTTSATRAAAAAGAVALGVLIAAAPAAQAAPGDFARTYGDYVTSMGSDACPLGGTTDATYEPDDGWRPAMWRVRGYTVSTGCVFWYRVEWLAPDGEWLWNYGEVTDGLVPDTGVEIQGTPCRIIQSLQRQDKTMVDVVNYLPGAPAGCNQWMQEEPEYVF